MTLTERIVRAIWNAQTKSEAQEITERILRDWEEENVLVIESTNTTIKNLDIEEEKEVEIIRDMSLADLIIEVQQDKEFFEFEEIEDTYLQKRREFRSRILVMSRLPSKA